MQETARGIDGAAAVVAAWLAEPTLEAHAGHVRNLTAQSPSAAEHLAEGLTLLAAGLAYSLSQTTGRPLNVVLAEISTAVKNASDDV